MGLQIPQSGSIKRYWMKMHCKLVTETVLSMILINILKHNNTVSYRNMKWSSRSTYAYISLCMIYIYVHCVKFYYNMLHKSEHAFATSASLCFKVLLSCPFLTLVSDIVISILVIFLISFFCFAFAFKLNK